MEFRKEDPLLGGKLDLITDRSMVRYFKAGKSWSESGFQEMLGFLRFMLLTDIQSIKAICVQF